MRSSSLGHLRVLLVEDAGLDSAKHLLHGRRDRAVAEGLERENGERLLNLDADLLNAKEEEGDGEGRRDGRPVVPRVAENAQSASGSSVRKTVRKRAVRRV